MSTQRAVLVRISTGEILNSNAYINASEAIIGPFDDLKYYVYYKPFEGPDYDSRYFQLVTTKELKTGTPHPDFPLYDQYLVSYSTQKRAIEEILLSAENAENVANQGTFPQQKQLKLIAMAVGILIRKSENLNLKPKEQQILNRASKVAENIFKNDAQFNQKKAAIEAGQEPDLDEGWETTDSTIEVPE